MKAINQSSGYESSFVKTKGQPQYVSDSKLKMAWRPGKFVNENERF